ncbi:hypothetical protein [Thalassospira xiamenensis]|uniref:Uncharacterized protein n=1 Tax=Thalassospira xiamenensis TaxID=220697 RepID=A0A285RBP3_9PROT|nr:hypothetical protein [Thalassospira xiamenensis]SOB91525.1 hypothetical protein SAMN05428964_101422 [Thalassospira xiamenensis]
MGKKHRQGRYIGGMASKDGGYTAILRIARLLPFTASPAFALMALVTGISEAGSTNIICLTTDDISYFNDMVAMYLLMSFFHLPPWLKALSGGTQHLSGNTRSFR